MNIPQPPYRVEKPQHDLQPASEHEWVLSIGNGGFAMGAASGVNRRKYHALLIASTNPPVDRLSCLTGLDETIEFLDPKTAMPGPAASLAAHRIRGAGGSTVIGRSGATLVRFEKSTTSVAWTYDVGGIELVKELTLGWRKNVCAVRYRLRTIDASKRAARLILTPRVALRDFHGTLPQNTVDRYKASAAGGTILVEAGGRSLAIECQGAIAALAPSMIRDVHLDFESERHQEDAEHVYAPGTFTLFVSIDGGGTSFVVSAALSPERPDLTLFQNDAKAKHLAAVRERFASGKPGRAVLGPLVDAADDFLVPRVVEGKPLMTVLAGFPWFADWGRDTMISLFGLMITTGRSSDALGCLQTFAKYVKDGMIPNLFDDYGGPPQYNTVDASLWFLHACTEYLHATGDRASFDAMLLPACLQIIERYETGTRFDIRMDPSDGLIAAGDPTTQLTWMDAKRDGVVFTPRHGKAVEINALWRHGLVCIAKAIEKSDPPRAASLTVLAEWVGQSFRAKFWNASERRLHDCLQLDSAGAWSPVPELRPNQIFAASLEHAPLSQDERRAVVACVRDRLLTPRGLRTLDPADPNYRPRFEGDMMSRDRAYHNGTVWPWLIGPYCEALLRAEGFSSQAKAEVRRVIQPLMDSLTEGCLGQVAEVYDAEEPRRPQGCIAQAWSVAELLRAAVLAL